MTTSGTMLIGLCAGLHAASYGAYKDSPHENFKPRRYVRELIIAASCAAWIAWSGLGDGQSPLVLYLSIFALARIATEFWKLFLRVEPQEDYRIPTQIHLFAKVVHDPAGRALLGAGFVGAIYGYYALCTLLPGALPFWVRGLAVGGGIGVCEALAGAYKDGSIEGFSFRKFVKSPMFGALGGLIAAAQTQVLGFLLLASIGTMRMFLELLFKLIVPDYVPGKFRSMRGPFTTWAWRRRIFLAPYTATWVLYVVWLARTV
jgi:hypothetical protein